MTTICDLTDAKLAAHASSKGDGRERWTELSVWHRPDHRTRPWVAEALGCSSLAGETMKVRHLGSGSLERALRMFDDSDLGVIVKEGAREWAKENGAQIAPAAAMPASDREALAAMFGLDPADVSIRAAARALKIGESSIRMAIRDDRDIRVPLRTLFPFIDRPAFRRAQGGERDRG